MRPAAKTFALAAATLILGLAALPSLIGQSRTPALPRLNGKPDLNGIWQALNTANWDIQAHSAKPQRRIGQHSQGPPPPLALSHRRPNASAIRRACAPWRRG